MVDLSVTTTEEHPSAKGYHVNQELEDDDMVMVSSKSSPVHSSPAIIQGHESNETHTGVCRSHDIKILDACNATVATTPSCSSPPSFRACNPRISVLPERQKRESIGNIEKRPKRTYDDFNADMDEKIAILTKKHSNLKNQSFDLKMEIEKLRMSKTAKKRVESTSSKISQQGATLPVEKVFNGGSEHFRIWVLFLQENIVRRKLKSEDAVVYILSHGAKQTSPLAVLAKLHRAYSLTPEKEETLGYKKVRLLKQTGNESFEKFYKKWQKFHKFHGISEAEKMKAFASRLYGDFSTQVGETEGHETLQGMVDDCRALENGTFEVDIFTEGEWLTSFLKAE